MNLYYLTAVFGLGAAVLLAHAGWRLLAEARATRAACDRASAARDDFLVSIARYGYVQENRSHE